MKSTQAREILSDDHESVLLALVASFLLIVLIIAGSRNLEHYDSALFGYTVASVVAFGAIVFRYAIWLQRPATRVYWRRGWKLYLQREKFVKNTTHAAKTFATNLVGQRFIFKRGFDYSMGNGTTLQDYCPRCKRIMRGLAYRRMHGTERWT